MTVYTKHTMHDNFVTFLIINNLWLQIYLSVFTWKFVRLTFQSSMGEMYHPIHSVYMDLLYNLSVCAYILVHALSTCPLSLKPTGNIYYYADLAMYVVY